jgi:hypothetical protein
MINNLTTKPEIFMMNKPLSESYYYEMKWNLERKIAKQNSHDVLNAADKKLELLGKYQPIFDILKKNIQE